MRMPLRPYLSLFLLLPDRFAPEHQLLKELVQDVNENEVDPKDRLSDNVYHYDAKGDSQAPAECIQSGG